MNDNFLKTLIFLLLTASISTVLTSCANQKQPYLISDFADINSLEEIDHQSCVNLKLNFDRNKNVDSKLYWHCRLSFSKFHIEVAPILPRQLEFNEKITDLVAKISLIISKSQETNIEREIDKIDESDHKKCVRLGYDPESRDQYKVEEYYQCRKNLIELEFVEPPFSNNEYEKYHTKSYDIAYVIDKRIKKSFENNQKKLANNPECSSFRPSSEDFKKCSESIEKYQQCLKDSKNKIREIEAEEKITCQRQAYIRFSDDMIKESERTESRIKNRNLNSDRDNKNSFESIGIDENDFLGKSEKEKVDQEKFKKIFAIENNSNNIYSKQEISKLRKNFIVNCISIIDSKLTKSKEELLKNCEKIKYTKADDQQQ